MPTTSLEDNTPDRVIWFDQKDLRLKFGNNKTLMYMLDSFLLGTMTPVPDAKVKEAYKFLVDTFPPRMVCVQHVEQCTKEFESFLSSIVMPVAVYETMTMAIVLGSHYRKLLVEAGVFTSEDETTAATTIDKVENIPGISISGTTLRLLPQIKRNQKGSNILPLLNAYYETRRHQLHLWLFRGLLYSIRRNGFVGLLYHPVLPSGMPIHSTFGWLVISHQALH